MWQGFFAAEEILRKLGLRPECACAVDFGCGYGTFSIPAARMIEGTVHALDIEPVMISATRAKGEGEGLSNLKASVRDFVEEGSGLAEGTADYAMLFNLLHAEEALSLVREAKRVLKPTGKLAVMHWNYDPKTPRGPRMEIRLKPEECARLVVRGGFDVEEIQDLPPYHYGFVAHPRRDGSSSD